MDCCLKVPNIAMIASSSSLWKFLNSSRQLVPILHQVLSAVRKIDKTLVKFGLASFYEVGNVWRVFSPSAAQIAASTRDAWSILQREHDNDLGTAIELCAFAVCTTATQRLDRIDPQLFGKLPRKNAT